MNYWPAFSTNIAETFEAYVEYNNAYMAKAEAGASSIVQQYNKDAYGTDGGNGWSIATGGYVFDIYGSESIGNLGFTTQLFWEYYAYTGDEYVLREVVYPVIVSAARFITKMVKEDADGNYIAISSDSPEQYVDGVWYYTSEGTGYAQSFAYQNNYNLLLAAQALGISASDVSHEDYAILNTVLKQIDKYDPVRVGYSGQVKEFFEEDYYGDLGEYTHRHISQLVGLYPGNVINGTTPAWIDAAKYTLTERGDKATGWGVAHRLNLWARVQDGERAYDLLEQLLKVNTATNLWDLHPPFQIDGNLGGTAGISEMLLQSHAGYVEPLAAIPSAWANGSYTGLVARGNFEVSAAWSDGLATSFNILSKNGGELSVKYGGIANATVTDSEGRAVSYTVTADDVITFNTEACETYYIWGFTAKNSPDAVEGLTLETAVLSDSKLTWNASSDAIGYNVYVAKEDAPVYTLLTSTTGTTYTYDRPVEENARLTFAVTAVGADGSESERTLAYRVPDDLSSPVLDFCANVIGDELQVTVKSTEYSAKFRLYSKATGNAEWTLVTESDYPIIIDNTYVKTNIYGVSAVNSYGEESEIVKISAFNVSTGSVDYNSANILEGLVFTPSSEGKNYQHSNTNYGDYGKLTDNNFDTGSGRFSTKATASDVFEGELLLPAKFLLGELKIYDFNGWSSTANFMGQHLKVETYCDGVWTTVVECSSNAEILALRKSDAKGNYISIDASLVKAQIIRIRIDTPTSGNSISINEIQLTGVAVGESITAVDNVFNGYVFADTNPSAGTAWKPYKYITDGKRGWDDPGRFATNSGKPADGTLDFGGKVYALSELKIEYTASNLCGQDISIYVLRNGTWTKVVEKVYDAGVSSIAFDLKGVEAEKVRFTVSGQAFGGNYVGVSEMTCTGYDTGKQVATKNILLGTTKDQITLTGATVHPSVPNLDYAFDGNKSTRYAVNDVAPYSYSLEIQLNNTYELHMMSFYPFFNGGEASRSNDTKIEVYRDGVWTTVVSGFTIEAATCSQVSLGGAVGSKIRITFKNTVTTQNATLWEIECTGLPCSDDGNSENTDSNVLANRTEDQLALGNASVHPGAGPLTDVFDGNKTNTRFAVAGAPSYVTLEIALDSEVPLYTMSFYPFYNGDTVSRSNNTKIEVYVDGVWITVVTGLEIAPTAAPTTASLGGIVAEKIRITFANRTGSTNVSIYEITCTTGAVDAVDRKPLLEVYKALDAIEPTDSDKATLKADKLAEMKQLLMDTKADADAVAAYIVSVNEAIDELNHVCFGGSPTCQKRAICSECGKEYGSLAPHTEITITAVAPTCTATGLTEGKKCTVCGVTTVEQTVVDALGHTEATLSAVAPTCTETGLTEGKQCTVCKTVTVAQTIVDALGHTEATLSAVAPTCTATGLTEGKKCSVCGTVTVEQTTVPTLAHTEETVPSVAPTCSATGLTEGKKCSVCGTITVEQTTVPTLAHTEETIPAVAPTCSATGLTEGKKCSVCGTVTVEQTTVPTLAHTEEPIPAVAPTCSATGLTEGKKCTVCGTVTVAQTTVPTLAHTEETISAVTPTCTETGLTAGKKCTVCGTVTVEQTVVDALGHVETDFPAKAPTCTETGLTEGKQCTVCLTVTVEQTVIPALGHKWQDGEEGKRTCETCGVNEEDTLPTDPGTTVEKNHEECTASELELLINAILNFLRELFGLPTKCICGDDL